MSERGLKREYVHAPLHSVCGMAAPQLVRVDVKSGSTFSAMQRDCDCCWDYVCNTFSGDGVCFQEASEAVAFPAGHCIAD